MLASINVTECTGATTPGVKPLDRDEHAIKTDEPSAQTLDPDPSKASAAICNMEEDPAAQKYAKLTEETNANDAYKDGGARDSDGVRDYSNVTATINITGRLKSTNLLRFSNQVTMR